MLPLDNVIIDCGAHIDDGAIPIAHTLKLLGRDDITVYAIDPSLYKVEFMKEIKEKNNLNNLVILQYGLSNVNNIYTHKKVNFNHGLILLDQQFGLKLNQKIPPWKMKK
jgi:non-ribosomal peptide synthetase component E (peptide arylation enzyme)